MCLYIPDVCILDMDDLMLSLVGATQLVICFGL
jgi:hypothetical protein